MAALDPHDGVMPEGSQAARPGTRSESIDLPEWMATMTARRRGALVVAALVLAVALVLALFAAAFAAVPVAIAFATAVFALVVGLRSRGRRWWPRRSRAVHWSAAEPPVVDGPSWTTLWDAPPTPSDLPATRMQATTVLTEWDVHGEAAEPTLLVLTELLTNAVEHARPPLRVTLRLGREFVRVEVCDATPEPPRYHPQEDEGRGHGVQLVAALALRHGWSPHPDGKTVWADVSDGWPD
jgi:Histidine kinase-like ATPase domain